MGEGGPDCWAGGLALEEGREAAEAGCGVVEVGEEEGLSRGSDAEEVEEGSRKMHYG